MSSWRVEVRSTNITQDQVDSRLQCSICLEDYRLREAVIKLNCVHFFHDTCIAPWLDKNNFCPTCRSRVVRNNASILPPTQDFSEEFPIEYELVENIVSGSDVTSLESESEESYIDDDNVFEESMSEQSEEDIFEDSETDDFSDLIEMADDDNDDIENDIDNDIENDIDDIENDIELETESVESENDDVQFEIDLIEMEEENNVEESNDEQVMSDDSNFYEAETGSVDLSDNGDYEQ